MKKNRILIADITIDFCSEVEADLTGISSIYRYHLVEDDGKPAMYRVDFVDSDDRFRIHGDVNIDWEGGAVSTINPIKIFNMGADGSKTILVNDDVLIEHKPAEKHTICRKYVNRRRKWFGFHKTGIRPKADESVLLITQMVLSSFGKYAFHGCCMAKNGSAYLFLGKSGSGKSTLSTILAENGYDFMGDDVVYIGKNDDNQLTAYSSLNDVKLFNERKTRKNNVDIIEKMNANYCYKSKIKAISSVIGNFYCNKTSFTKSTSANLYEMLIRSSNNAIMQYDKRHWLQLCYELAELPYYMMLFGNKKYFDSSVMKILDA